MTFNTFVQHTMYIYVVCDYSQEPIMMLTRKPKRAPAITKTHFSKTL